MGRKFRLKLLKRMDEPPPFSLPLSIPLPSLEVASAASELCTMRSPLTVSISNDALSPLKKLHCSLKKSSVVSPEWKTSMWDHATMLVLYKLRMHNDDPQVYISIQIRPDYSWELKLCGKSVNRQSQFLCSMPEFLSTEAEVGKLLAKLECNSKICAGNDDTQYLALAATRNGKFYNRARTEIVAYIDDITLSPTIRHSECELLVEQGKRACHYCTQYRNSLRSMAFQQKASSSRTNSESHVNYRSAITPHTPTTKYLTDTEMKKRLHHLHQSVRSAEKKVEAMKRKLEEISNVHGITLDSVADQDIRDIMKEHSQSIASTHPPSTFRRVFWEQQMKAASSSARQMRWHPAMIKWCIYLRHRSSGAYETLRKSGCIHLPSQRTLRDYTHIAGSRIGFSKEVDEMLMRCADIAKCPEHQKYVAVIFDEMHIRADLVYNKHNGELVGFCNLGEVNNCLLEVEKSVGNCNPKPDLAKSMLVFMVRGLCGPLKFPYAQFSTKDITGDLLFNPFWDVVYHLERCGFRVIAATADGATPNRAFLRIPFPSKRKSAKSYDYRVPNPYTEEDRFIYFFSDPPHLLKTIRNCMATTKRQLWCEGEEITWRHLISLYYRNNGSIHDQLSLVPKLKYEHVYLNSFSKMRVDLAAQALSGTVAAALRMTGGPAAQKTAEFVELVDKFFDCLNVRNFESGKHSRNNFKDPFRPGDFRLKWLEEEFLAYLDQWEVSVFQRQGDFSQSERNKMLLSAETRLGIRFTVRSFIDMTNYLFSQPNIDCFLSEKISQDPLEKFFGTQRQRGRVNENPNMSEFCQNTQALRVTNSVCWNVARGNTRGGKKDSSEEEVVSDEPLAKRRRRS